DRVPAAASGEDEREGREDVDDGGEGRERVGQRGLVEATHDLHEAAAGGGERHDGVDDDEDAAEARHAGARDSVGHGPPILGRHSPRAGAGRHPAIWTVQITCMRHSMTASASPTTPRMTVLHRLRSRRAQNTPPTGSSTAETRYTQYSSRSPVGGFPA